MIRCGVIMGNPRPQGAQGAQGSPRTAMDLVPVHLPTQTQTAAVTAHKSARRPPSGSALAPDPLALPTPPHPTPPALQQLPALWFFTTAAANVSLLPYLNVFLAGIGCTPTQLGLLSCVRPWVSSISGVLLPGLADRHRRHRGLFLMCFLASTLLRGGLFLVHAPGPLLVAALLLAEALAAPVGVLADAMVLAAAKDVSGR